MVNSYKDIFSEIFENIQELQQKKTVIRVKLLEIDLSGSNRKNILKVPAARCQLMHDYCQDELGWLPLTSDLIGKDRENSTPPQAGDMALALCVDGNIFSAYIIKFIYGHKRETHNINENRKLSIWDDIYFDRETIPQKTKKNDGKLELGIKGIGKLIIKRETAQKGVSYVQIDCENGNKITLFTSKEHNELKIIHKTGKKIYFDNEGNLFILAADVNIKADDTKIDVKKLSINADDIKLSSKYKVMIDAKGKIILSSNVGIDFIAKNNPISGVVTQFTMPVCPMGFPMNVSCDVKSS